MTNLRFMKLSYIFLKIAQTGKFANALGVLISIAIFCTNGLSKIS